MKKTPLKRTAFKSKPHKYGAEKSDNQNFRELSGRSFPSKLERNCAVMLVIRQRAGEISDLQFQKVFTLTEANISYNADFAYTEDGKTVVLEAKGLVSDRWRIIRKLWKYYGEYKLIVCVAGQGGRVRLKETIIPRDMI